MTRLTLTSICLAGLLAVLPIPAAAQMPDSVMEPYREWTAERAKPSPDPQAVASAAFAAWQAAEDALGDTKTTGDLAANFAHDSVHEFGGRVRTDAVEDAWERAVELADLYPEGERDDIRVQRRVSLAQHHILRCVHRDKDCRKARRALGKLSEDLDALGWQGRTYGAELHALTSHLELLVGKDKAAIAAAERARDAYAVVDDGLLSLPRYQYPLYHAVALKRTGRKVEAARALQALVADHFELAGDYTGPSVAGYLEYLDLADELDPETPGAAEVLAWVPPATTGSFAPARKVPPVMPADARRSGWAMVIYDIEPSGRVTNVRVTDASQPLFRKPAKAAAEAWIHSPGMPADRRRDVPTLISFRLAGPTGKLIPGPPPPSLD